jgi:general secretion pathway protein C
MRMFNQKIIAALNVSIGLLILLSLGFFVRNVLSAVQNKGIKPVSYTHIASAKQEKKSLQEYEAVFQNNPFSITVGSLKQNVSGAAQKEMSDIKLMGTISGSAEYSYAVFVDKDGKQAMFKKGESVFGAGELKTVEKYRAIINSNGTLVEIKMTDIHASGGLEALKSPGAMSGPVQLVGKGEYMIDQKAVKLALDNPTQIMTDAKLIHNMTKDKQEGFIVREVRKNGFYENLGIQNGDVLLRVNGSNISNPENALQTFTALRGMDKVQLDIIRNNNRMTLNYQIR